MSSSVAPVPVTTDVSVTDLSPPEAVEPAAPEYYAINSARVSLTEYRYGTPLLMMPIAALLKALRIQLPSSTDDLNADSLPAGEVEALSEGDLVPLEPMLAELRTLGFVEVLYHAFDDTLTHTRRRLVTLASDDGSAIARVGERVWTGTKQHKTYRHVEFITAFDDGTFLWSTSAKPDMLAPANIEVVRKVGATPADLWSAHQAAAAQRAERRRIIVARTAGEVREIAERHHTSLRDFHLARGVFRPAKRGAAAGLPREVAAAVGADNAMVYAEMQRLQNKQGRWTTAVLILAARAPRSRGRACPARGAGRTARPA